MTVTYESPASANGLHEIPGVSDLNVDGHTLRMKVEGTADLDAVLRQVLEQTVVDMEFDTPSLEEIFLSFYGKRSE
jgi:ABC-type uncharacterized transport system ATPase subunit